MVCVGQFIQLTKSTPTRNEAGRQEQRLGNFNSAWSTVHPSVGIFNSRNYHHYNAINLQAILNAHRQRQMRVTAADNAKRRRLNHHILTTPSSTSTPEFPPIQEHGSAASLISDAEFQRKSLECEKENIDMDSFLIIVLGECSSSTRIIQSPLKKDIILTGDEEKEEEAPKEEEVEEDDDEISIISSNSPFVHRIGIQKQQDGTYIHVNEFADDITNEEFWLAFIRKADHEAKLQVGGDWKELFHPHHSTTPRTILESHTQLFQDHSLQADMQQLEDMFINFDPEPVSSSKTCVFTTGVASCLALVLTGYDYDHGAGIRSRALMHLSPIGGYRHFVEAFLTESPSSIRFISLHVFGGQDREKDERDAKVIAFMIRKWINAHDIGRILLLRDVYLHISPKLYGRRPNYYGDDEDEDGSAMGVMIDTQGHIFVNYTINR